MRKAAKLPRVGLFLSEENEALMERLFGPRIPDIVSGSFDEAKSVQADSLSDIEIGLNVLVGNIVASGIGGPAMGWRLYQSGGRIHLSVCRIKQAKAA